MQDPTSLPLSLAVPSSSSSLSCLNLPEGPIQFVPTISTLPHGLWQISEAGTGVSSIFIYHGECRAWLPDHLSLLPDYSLTSSSPYSMHLAVVP